MYLLFSVYDRVAELYGGLVQQRNEAVASRAFAQACLDRGDPVDGNPLFLHPDDFELRILGSFDEVTGQIVPIGPSLVLSARAVQLSQASAQGDA